MATKKTSKQAQPSDDVTVDDKPGFAPALISWYKHNHREMPWRNTKNPYHIWLSEIMLQQTQVATVISYYQRFLEWFPTIEDLAKAPTEKVMKAWEGLGYYARCRNLQKAAQVIVEHHGGQFPDTFDEVVALPGIGQSTAGAILTFAFDKPHPLLDGNVKRVLARLYNIQDDVTQTKTTKEMWACSSALLAHADDAYSYNQGIMELGATLCTPKNPQCLLCPVRECCDGAAAGTQNELPKKAPTKKTPHYHIGVGVILDPKTEKILIQLRPSKGLLGGLWEFPGGKQEPNEEITTTVTRELMEELDIEVTVGPKITEVNHAYSHFKVTLHAYWCRFDEGEPVPKVADAWQWVEQERLTEFAFPKANNRILDVLPDTPPPAEWLEATAKTTA